MTKPPRDEAYAEHAREQRRAWLRTTPAERLAWLAQAKRFCAEALELANARRGKSKDSPERLARATLPSEVVK